MPYLGQDWSSSGAQWVRTPEGWRKVEAGQQQERNDAGSTTNIPSPANSHETGVHQPRDLQGCPQPFVFISRTVSREVITQQTNITEVLDKLGFRDAVNDVRRFNYVCKLLELLIEQKLARLSGMAQKRVMTLLDLMLEKVLSTETNLHLMKHLAEITYQALMLGMYNHMGGKRLWDQHFDCVSRIQTALTGLQLTERVSDGLAELSDLPDDLVREVLLRLEHHQDILTMSLVDTRINRLAHDQEVWKNLCLYHYGEQLCGRHIKKAKSVGWMTVYRELLDDHKTKEGYAECLCICTHCNALYWQLHGHPCIESRAECVVPPEIIVLSPEDCIKHFAA